MNASLLCGLLHPEDKGNNDPLKNHKLFTQSHGVNNQEDLNHQVSFSVESSPNSE